MQKRQRLTPVAGFSTRSWRGLRAPTRGAGAAAGPSRLTSQPRPLSPATPVDYLITALLYSTERWDGAGYPEGLRGESIPRVARAFAVLRGYAEGGVGGGTLLRAEAGRRFDPRMVNRFLAFLGEEASRWNPLDGVAGESGRG